MVLFYGEMTRSVVIFLQTDGRVRLKVAAEFTLRLPGFANNGHYQKRIGFSFYKLPHL